MSNPDDKYDKVDKGDTEILDLRAYIPSIIRPWIIVHGKRFPTDIFCARDYCVTGFGQNPLPISIPHSHIIYNVGGVSVVFDRGSNTFEPIYNFKNFKTPTIDVFMTIFDFIFVRVCSPNLKHFVTNKPLVKLFCD